MSICLMNDEGGDFYLALQRVELESTFVLSIRSIEAWTTEKNE
jgi:hypothetical protein